MASSLLLSSLSGVATTPNRVLSSDLRLNKSTWLSSPHLIFAPYVPTGRTNAVRRYCYRSPVAKSLDHIPKQFREENLKEGLMDNYKSAPSHLYGLTSSQMDMFMKAANPVARQSESVTEESLSSAYNYAKNGEMMSASERNEWVRAKCGMSVRMLRGGARRSGRRRRSPPDLPSLLLDSRIVFLGMPIVPAVCELLVAQFMWLDYDNQTKPIYLYINSSGTRDNTMQIVGAETDAYAIVDSMAQCKAPIYTVNLGKALGQSAMLLSLGKKGYRAVLPSSLTSLYLPKVGRSSGVSTDMWIRAKELDVNTDTYVELLARGLGKPKEEVKEDVRLPKHLLAQEAVDYGIADRIMYSLTLTDERKDSEANIAKAKAMREKALQRSRDDNLSSRN